MKRRHKITVIAVILVFLALAGWLQYRKAHSEAVLQQAIFVATKDGDSMVVNLDGEETEVRLIGVNTPERGTTEGDEAYTLEITDQEGHAVKFRASNVSDWSNQIQRYDQDSAKWFNLDNYILPVATKDTTLVFDFSETNTSNQ